MNCGESNLRVTSSTAEQLRLRVKHVIFLICLDALVERDMVSLIMYFVVVVAVVVVVVVVEDDKN